MKNRHKSRVESKSRNSGRIVSFVMHAILLIVLFLPIFAMKPPEEPTKEALVIQFDYPYNQYVKPEVEKFEEPENMDMASKMSGSEAGGSPASEEAKQSRPQEAAPSRLATPTVTSVMKTSSALRSNIGEIPLPTPKIVTQQAWQSVNDFSSFESDGVEEMRMIDQSDGGFGDVAGALGGKLLGAGGSGFILFYCPEHKQEKFRREMQHARELPFQFENYGSKIIYIAD